MKLSCLRRVVVTIASVSILVVVVCLGLRVSVVVAGEGAAIPADRLFPWRPGVESGVKTEGTIVELSAAALKEGDAAVVIQKAIDGLTPPAVALLPEGEFRAGSTITMRSGVTLRGRGFDRTRLVFEFPEKTRRQPSVSFRGSAGKEVEVVDAELKVGASRLTVSDPSGFADGDMIHLTADTDPAAYTETKWKVGWAARSWGQILRVAAVDGASVTLDTPSRLSYVRSRSPRLQKIKPIERSGLERLSLKRLDDGDSSMIAVDHALNCWISGIESSYCMRGHVWISFSRFITVEGSIFHHAHNYGGGGHGYGVVAGRHATDCLITNNIFHHLRHSMMTKEGASGNVFSYNYSFDSMPVPEAMYLVSLCDVSIHGHYSHRNLFEGNVVEFVNCADYWGPAGPLTTFFRNRVANAVKVKDYSERVAVVCNTIGGTPSVAATCRGVLVDGNRVKGVMSWQSAPAGSVLPASLYLEGRPAFWGERPWPCVGADVDTDSAHLADIPAQSRWRVLCPDAVR